MLPLRPSLQHRFLRCLPSSALNSLLLTRANWHQGLEYSIRSCQAHQLRQYLHFAVLCEIRKAQLPPPLVSRCPHPSGCGQHRLAQSKRERCKTFQVREQKTTILHSYAHEQHITGSNVLAWRIPGTQPARLGPQNQWEQHRLDASKHACLAAWHTRRAYHQSDQQETRAQRCHSGAEHPNRAFGATSQFAQAAASRDQRRKPQKSDTQNTIQ
jgi:hypothetical protein